MTAQLIVKSEEHLSVVRNFADATGQPIQS